MVIRRLTVENFKRFERSEVEFSTFDCVVGSNNSGKTTLLQSLALFDFCVHHCISGTNGSLRLRPRTIAAEQFYVLPIADPVDLWTDRKTQAGGRHKVITLTIEFATGQQATATIDLNYNRFGVSVETTDTSIEGLERLRSLRISYLPVFSSFMPQEERRTPAIIADELARGRVHSVIRNLLLDLKSENRSDELIKILSRLFPDLRGMKIEFDEANDRYISVSYREKSRPKDLDVFSAGSGFQQFLYLFGFIILRQPTVILLDEPDVHLHGTLQRALLAELSQFVDGGRQVIFATHSRDMIGRMSPEQILALEHGSAKRLKVAFDVYDTLDQLGSVDPTQLPTIQAYRRVVIVEGRTDRDLLTVYCAKVLGTDIWQQVERRVAFCFARGNPWKSDMNKLREQLHQMIAVDGAPLEAFVLADRDYHPDLQALRAKVPSNHLAWHVWERAEIENYLLSLPALIRIAAETPEGTQTTIAESLVEKEFRRLLESSRDIANDKLVKAFQEYSRAEGENSDVVTLSRRAREYLAAHWEKEHLALADAKDLVLPGMKRWLQSSGLGQFSDKALAETLRPEELPPEVHALARELVKFAGLSLATQ